MLIFYMSGDLQLTISESKKRNKKQPAPLTPLVESPKKSVRRSRSKSKTSKTSIPKRKTFVPATQQLPLVVGNFYLKVENFDLEKLSVKKNKLILLFSWFLFYFYFPL